MRRRDSRIPRTLQIAAAFEGEKIGHIAGDIVRFRGDGSPLRSLRVGIDPVQDLHGYDAPWPGGGGKNKFDVFKLTPSADISISANGTITVTGNAKNGGQRLKNCADVVEGETYVLSATTTGGANYVYLYGTNTSWYFGTQRTLTQSDLDSYVFFYGGVDTTSQISNMMIRLSSVSDASFAPYSNICPISGWDEANVWRTGKNLIDLSFLEFDDSVYVHDYYPATTPQVTEYAQLMAKYVGKTIVLSASITGTQSAGAQPVGSIRLANSGGGVFRLNPNTPTTVPDMDYSNVSYLIIYGSINGASVSDIQIELGSTPTAYAPYTGTTATIQLGQTVYGGTLDVLSGVLTVTHAEVDLGTLRWVRNASRQNFYAAVSGSKGTPQQELETAICSAYHGGTYGQANGADNRVNGAFFIASTTHIIYLNDERYADESDPLVFKAAVSGVQLVYELATPITIPLSDITISTLAGQNVVWGDCGNVTVEYLSAGGANPDLMKLAVAFMGR